MATTVHIPEPILRLVDKRAKVLKLSRNRFIIDALEKALGDQSKWSPEFLQSLRALPPLGPLDDLLENIRANRTSKVPPIL